MDIFLVVLALLLILTGIAGSVVPVIPGPPLAYLGLIALQFTSFSPFGTRMLVIYGILTVAITAIDIALPSIGTRYFGGSKKGVWGSGIGLVAGMFIFPPFGILVGPFLGALIGELLDGKEGGPAFKAALGSFTGFLAGTIAKMGVCFIMGYHFIRVIIQHFF